MGAINTIIGVPLGYVIYAAYALTHSFGWAIVLFTVVTRVVLFPVNVLAHNNAIRFLKLQPALDKLKRRFAADKEALNEEQYELFKKEKYNPFIGIVPLLLQLVLIMGVLQVMYHPLQHMMHLDTGVIETLQEANVELTGKPAGFSAQLSVLESLSHSENVDFFKQAMSGVSDGAQIVTDLSDTGLDFFGINLGEVPSILHPSSALVIVALSGLSALLLCLIQNKLSPAAMTQSQRANTILTLVTIALSLYFALVMPAGVGLYWALGNLVSILVVLLLNKLYNPMRLAPEAVSAIEAKKAVDASRDRTQERQLKKESAQREKRDIVRFKAADKKLVFYGLTAGQYKYYAEIIDYLRAHSDLAIHYVTNDPADPVLDDPPSGVIPYYMSHQKTIRQMLTLDTDMLVTTVPDLQNYHFKRTVARDDTEYAYVFHGFTSVHMVMREGALDNYDTVFCVGDHHVAELRGLEQLYGTKKKQLLKVGYGGFDRLLREYEASESVSDRPQIVIAPSWQTENIMESCIDEVLDQLIGQGYRIVVRPHPEYIKLFGDEIAALKERFARHVESGELLFELEFMESSSLYASDVLITDWSNTAYEFAFTSKKPVVFINTPMKVMNTNYEALGIEPSDLSLRDQVGVSLEVDQLPKLGAVIADMIEHRDQYHDQIAEVTDAFVYHPGRSGDAAGKYIIKRLG